MGHGLSILAILQALLSERALGHEELLFERGLTARLADDRSGESSPFLVETLRDS